MKKITRILAATFLFFPLFGVYQAIANVGRNIFEYGNEMANITSVGGNSIAEAYYQLQGIIYANFGIMIEQGAGLVLIAAISLAILILYPIFTEKTTSVEHL